MPVIPRFSVSQTADLVVLVIRVPYVRVSEAEVAVDGKELSFYCKPYLLRLTLPGELVDDERISSTYDADAENGTLTVSVPKATPGEHFPDLDLVTKLLQPRATFPVNKADTAQISARNVDIDLSHVVSQPEDDGENDESGHGRLASGDTLAQQLSELSLRGPQPSKPTRPLIEVIDSSQSSASSAAIQPVEESSIESAVTATEARNLPTESADVNPCIEHAPALTPGAAAPRYGFNRSFTGVFASLREELPDILDLAGPDTTPESMRRLLRETDEELRFDPLRYASDNSAEAAGEDPIYQEAMGMTPWWCEGGVATATAPAGNSSNEGSGGEGDAASAWEWSESEVEDMRQLPRREYLIDGAPVGPSHSSSAANAAAGIPCVDPASQPEALRLLTTLVPILASYAYDHRATGGEPTCESAWGLCVLSPALSWLDDDVTSQGVEEVAAAIASGALAEAAGAAPDAAGLLAAVRGFAASAGGAQAPDIGLTPAAHSSASGAAPAAPVSSMTFEGALRTAASSFQRRALTFPYLRRWDMGLRALKDAARLLSRGRRAVLRALLAARRILRADDQRYLLCTLWLDDLCVWVQCAPEAWVVATGAALAAALPAKADGAFASWQLERIDREGPEAVIEEGEEGEGAQDDRE